MSISPQGIFWPSLSDRSAVLPLQRGQANYRVHGIIGVSGYVSSMNWDKSNHLYAVNGRQRPACTSTTFTPTKESEVAGSPYTIPGGAQSVLWFRGSRLVDCFPTRERSGYRLTKAGLRSGCAARHFPPGTPRSASPRVAHEVSQNQLGAPIFRYQELKFPDRYPEHRSRTRWPPDEMRRQNHTGTWWFAAS